MLNLVVMMKIGTDFNLLKQSRPGSNLTGFIDLDSTPADQVTDKHKVFKTGDCITVDSLGNLNTITTLLTMTACNQSKF